MRPAIPAITGGENGDGGGSEGPGDDSCDPGYDTPDAPDGCSTDGSVGDFGGGDGEDGDDGGDCFLTTAVVERRGVEADDGPTLTALRGFRDGYMMQTPKRRALVAEYYEIAPRIAAAIPTRAPGLELDWRPHRHRHRGYCRSATKTRRSRPMSTWCAAFHGALGHANRPWSRQLRRRRHHVSKEA